MSLIASHRDEVLVAACVFCVILSVALAILWLRLGRMNRRYSSLMRSLAGGDVETALRSHSETVEAFAGRQDAHERRLRELADAQRRCIQRIGFVRFDAFEEVGGEQSFALALVDAEQNGITISNLYGRSESRVYAKSIQGGKPSHTLTQEETRALTQADER